MDWSWLWQNLLSSIVWELALIVGGGAVLAWIKAKRPQLAPPVFYGVIGAACFGVILFTLTGRSVLSHQKPETTPENIEANIRSWTDTFGLGVQKQSEDPQVYFTYILTLHNGVPVQVSRSRAKDKDRYIYFTEKMVASADLQDKTGKLSDKQARRAMQELGLELAKLNIDVAVVGAPRPNIIGMIKAVPITASFDLDAFVGYLDEMNHAHEVCDLAWALAIEDSH